jgi:hypothetical protein
MMRCAVKGGGVGVVVGGGQRRSSSASGSGFGSRSVVRMPEDRGLCCGVRSRAADLAGLEMGRPAAGAVFRSPRYGRVRATAGGASFVNPGPARVSGFGCFCHLGMVVRACCQL